MKNKHAGFTLIELLIVISIIAILAVNAIPAYSQYLQKARRADARTALLSLQLAQEKFRVNCRSYAITINENIVKPCDTLISTFTLKESGESPEKFYLLALTPPNDTTCPQGVGLSLANKWKICYTLTATPATGKAQENDTSCSTISIDQDSNKTSSPSQDDCW